jgi:hypothetical protein
MTNSQPSIFVSIAGTITGSYSYAISLSNILSVELHGLSIKNNCRIAICSVKTLRFTKIASLNTYGIDIDGEYDRALLLRKIDRTD